MVSFGSSLEVVESPFTTAFDMTAAVPAPTITLNSIHLVNQPPFIDAIYVECRDIQAFIRNAITSNEVTARWLPFRMS